MTALVRLPLQQQSDFHLLHVQREYERKRRAAFACHAQRAAMQSAYAEMSRTHPHLPAVRYVPPIRANEPMAGDACYEPQAVTPGGRGKLALCVLMVSGAVLLGLLWAGLRWRVGATW